jgi:DNA mismatch repair protein MutS
LSEQTNLTPLMAQFFQLKAKYPDAVLLYRVGDFYETFGEDAVKTSKALGITLTARNNGGSDVELAGFPYHSLDLYLPRLVRAGYRVAICEQMDKPTPGKKLVTRSVTEVVTPGVTTDDALLDHSRNNYLATMSFAGEDRYGLAFLDISTGEFLVTEGDQSAVDKLLQAFQPSELILPKGRQKQFETQFGDRFYRYALDDWHFSYDYTREKLLRHFDVPSLKGFGIEDMELSQVAAGVALHYLSTTENTRLQHISTISRVQNDKHLWLDRFTIRNLELVHPNHENGKSLIDVLDMTESPMGARMLRKWVLLPLTQVKQIVERQDVVAWLLEHSDAAQLMTKEIKQCGDMERLMSKAAVGKINPREVMQVRRSLLAVAALKEITTNSGHAALRRTAEALNPCATLRERIERDLAPDPPVNIAKGGAIATGASEELDELRHIVANSKEILLGIQQREIEATGISSLKIGFNNVFGYYLEVTNRFKDEVPTSWIRKQTLTSGERYITEELKVIEQKILGAEERMSVLEEGIYTELIQFVTEYIKPLQLNAHLIAELDCLSAFGKLSIRYNYQRPVVDDSLEIDIKLGRHPVIETQLPPDQTYIPNDVYFDHDQQQIMMITGPNMSGKSALLRQTALICLMAQTGCYVPAESARIGVLDKIFTRVGASDNISSGESTFMVEMNETALIMNSISSRSLILLDEIGRGTSTYDGISIAWSIAEYLHDHPTARAKTLFATHYHELNELAERLPRIHNYHVSTKQIGQKVIFMRTLALGGSQHSFGIHVARMAGMPQQVLTRANEILAHLEQMHASAAVGSGPELIAIDGSKATTTPENAEMVVMTTAIPSAPMPKRAQSPTRQSMQSAPAQVQLSIFELDEITIKIKDELLKLDLDAMTPIDALWKLNELRKLVRKG